MYDFNSSFELKNPYFIIQVSDSQMLSDFTKSSYNMFKVQKTTMEL